MSAGRATAESTSALAPGWSDRWSFLWWFAIDLARQLTLPGLALAILGLGALARGAGRAAAAAAGSGLLALVGNSLVLILLLGFDFDELRLAVFRPYPLICYGVAALWLAAGMQCLLDRLPGWTAARLPARSAGLSRTPWVTRGTTALAVLTGAAMVVASASANWRVNDRSRSDFAEWYADVIFDALPQDAVLFAYSDGSAGPSDTSATSKNAGRTSPCTTNRDCCSATACTIPSCRTTRRRRCWSGSSAPPIARCS